MRRFLFWFVLIGLGDTAFAQTNGLAWISFINAAAPCVNTDLAFYIHPGGATSPVVSSKSDWYVTCSSCDISYMYTQSTGSYDGIVVSPHQSGTITVSAYVSYGYSNTQTSGRTADVSTPVWDYIYPSIAVQANNEAVCDQTVPVTFTATVTKVGYNQSGTYSNYGWFVNGVSQPETQNTLTRTLQNGDQVYATTTSDMVCATNYAESNRVKVSIVTRPAPRIGLTSLIQTGGAGESIRVKANISGAEPNPTLVWTVDGQVRVSNPISSDPRVFNYPKSNGGPMTVGLAVTTTGSCPTTTNSSIMFYDCIPVNGLSLSPISATQFLCAMKFSSTVLPTSGYSSPTNYQYKNCRKSYTWSFGDGTTSNDPSPIHAYASSGTYSVGLTVNYNCTMCSKVLTTSATVTYTTPALWTEPQLISYSTQQKPGILTTSASTYADAWPLSHPNSVFDDKNGFVTASQGVWRNNGAFVYKKDRQLSPTTDLSIDGTFTLDQFNWQYADVLADANWIRADNMTRYSPYGFELESKDVLDVYSGAIYEYGGQLPVANGVNMRNDEMAFTSFEVFAGNVTAGNWTLSSGSIPSYYYYRVNSGDRNMAIVEASQAQLSGIVNVDVSTDKPNGTGNTRITYTKGNQIVCTQTDPDNTNWSMVVLENAPVPSYWSGTLRVKNQVSPNINPAFDSNFAHSGRTSLKITSGATFSGVKQEQLRLAPGQTYFVSGWASVGTNPATPSLGSNVGMTIVARANNGTAIQTFPVFAPTGPVIEGWQQFQGTFAFPATASYIDVTFLPGASGAWYDDVRLQPQGGNMKCYVYDVDNFRLKAILDEDNFASYFYYDLEGSLYVTKKETTDGMKTLTENMSYQKEQ